MYIRPPSRKWSEAEDERLIELWNANEISASIIADRVGRTKNAIVGRAARLGLQMRIRAAIPRGPETVLPPRMTVMSQPSDSPSRQVKIRRPRIAPHYDLVPRPLKRLPGFRIPEPQPWTGEPVPFLEVGPSQCRAIVGSSDDRNHLPLFCGGPVPYGQPFSYCADHLKIYTNPRSRR